MWGIEGNYLYCRPSNDALEIPVSGLPFRLDLFLALTLALKLDLDFQSMCRGRECLRDRARGGVRVWISLKQRQVVHGYPFVISSSLAENSAIWTAAMRNPRVIGMHPVAVIEL